MFKKKGNENHEVINGYASSRIHSFRYDTFTRPFEHPLIVR